MIGVSIQVSLKGEDEEKAFLAAFTHALEFIDRVPGLLEFSPAKTIGKEHTYQIFMLWESEQAIDAWMANPIYRDEIRKGGERLVNTFRSYRWRTVRDPRRIG